LSRRYVDIRPFIDQESASQNEDLNRLLEDLALFGQRNSGYAAARSYAISAGIYEDQRDWAKAEEAWVNAARAGGKTYFAPVAYFNAAVAAEEQGNLDGAIDYYSKALEYENVFPTAPRAQFSIARLQETQGDRRGALLSYMALVSKWPRDQVWVNLAHSRIILLSMD
jgi:tetratricopeptide (TPR) repeat protein